MCKGTNNFSNKCEMDGECDRKCWIFGDKDEKMDCQTENCGRFILFDELCVTLRSK